MPIPEVIWPLAPKGLPGMGVFIMLRGKVKAPLSRSLQRLHTALLAMLPPSFKATAWAQLAGMTAPTGVVQKVGFSAALKNGCSVIAAMLPTQLPPPRFCAFCGNVAPAQYCHAI